MQLLLDIAPESPPTLENFVAGRNAELLAALHSGLGDTAPPGLYLWGESGSGKSHLLQATVAAARARGLSAEYACGELPATTAHLVAIDAVERLNAAAQIGLFARYNQLRADGGWLLVAGSSAPAYLALRDDLRTRLGWGLIYQLHSLNDAEKSEALLRHATARGFELPAEVLGYLLRHGRRDLPSLLATLDALDERCLRQHRMASVPLLREVMENQRAPIDATAANEFYSRPEPRDE